VYSGYGQDGIGLTQALERFGFDVRILPAHVDAPLPQDVANILTKPLAAPVDLIIQHQDPTFLGLSPEEQVACDVRVGASMWEFCVDESTEIFTKRGWLKWNQVRIGDETLAIDPNVNASKWSPITNLFISKSRQRDMTLMEMQCFSSLTTQSHRWLIRNMQGNWDWKTTDTLNTASAIPRSIKRHDAPVDKKYSNAFVEIIAWIYTEGWLECGKSIRIGQSNLVNPHYVNKIRNCLTKLYGNSVARNNPYGGFTWSESIKDDGMVIFNISRQASLELLNVMQDKAPSLEFLLSLTLSQLKRFIKISVYADGCKVTKNVAAFGQSNKNRLDSFIYACILAGLSITKTFGTSYKSVHVSDKERYVRPKSPNARNVISNIQYNGRVWCPTTTYGNWLARRNGCIYFTGNSTLDNAPKESLKTLSSRLRSLDLFLPYDENTAGCFRPYLNNAQPSKNGMLELDARPAPRMEVLQGGYDPSLWTKVDRDWNSDRFAFCMVGALHARKDPYLAIEAFRQLKAEHPEFEPAELHLKTTAATLHPGMKLIDPRIFIYCESWSIEKLQKFYSTQHVMLCPSRGEGKNLPPLEFMTTGGTAIATNWGGHLGWISDKYAYPLDYTLRSVMLDKPECMNARASVEHLKALMWHCFTHRDEVHQKGELASEVIPYKCSWDHYVENLVDKVCALPIKGEQFRNAISSINK
jgi:glycosyltransferase involved in cell wall biosynthesis